VRIGQALLAPPHCARADWLCLPLCVVRVCVLLQRQLGETSQPQLLQGSLGVLVTRVRRQAIMYSACFIIVWIFPLIR
jgi:hypothetical protein